MHPHVTYPVLKFLPFTTQQAALTASRVEGDPRCRCASESDQRAYLNVFTPLGHFVTKPIKSQLNV